MSIDAVLTFSTEWHTHQADALIASVQKSNSGVPVHVLSPRQSDAPRSGMTMLESTVFTRPTPSRSGENWRRSSARCAGSSKRWMGRASVRERVVWFLQMDSSCGKRLRSKDPAFMTETPKLNCGRGSARFLPGDLSLLAGARDTAPATGFLFGGAPGSGVQNQLIVLVVSL